MATNISLVNADHMATAKARRQGTGMARGWVCSSLTLKNGDQKLSLPHIVIPFENKYIPET